MLNELVVIYRIFISYKIGIIFKELGRRADETIIKDTLKASK